ncbi:hypothetical protein RND71_019512 [Anisodus tanguticus]|uniref:Peptidase M24 domain-containing protein n=1 Tax=Anisodus tanguticus TaxID=243964 RepID=A0AAE1RZ70_9SOLA|nr:hypothetical protein RND71_019512 [Anisodus tanguticus]
MSGIPKDFTEVSASDKLEEFRASKEHFRGLSFPTISSVGSNGAIIHYSPEAETCAELDPDQMYLCDSGAQVCEISFGLVMIQIVWGFYLLTTS